MLLLAIAPTLVFAALTQQPPSWRISENPPGGYAVDTAGSPLTGEARVTIKPANASSTSSLSMYFTTLADTFRMRRVIVSGEVRGHGQPQLTVTEGNLMTMASETVTDTIAPSDTAWIRKQVSVVVSRSATIVALGVTVRGTADLEVRGLRLSVENLPATNATLGTEAQRELDSALAIVRRISYWRDTVSWPRLEADVRAIAGGARTAAETYPAIRELLSRLGDHHSFLMPANQSSQWLGGTLAKNPLPTVKSPDEGIGYVSIPEYVGADSAGYREYAQGTYALLEGVASSAGCGWIVDLRQDSGGNMWPMLAGLKPFVGSVPLGRFSSASGNGSPWIAGSFVNVDAPASLASLASATVAVLIGPGTASSGEAVAVAFHGRPRTRFFGQSTKGLANSNSTVRLPDGAIMNVMSAIDVDRNGQRFGGKVSPDEMIDGAVSAAAPGMTNDPAVTAAMRWLSSQSSCAERRRLR
jgi:hypothetical protein